MAEGFANIAKIPELRKRILFTLAMLAVYRIGIFVPTPGISAEAVRKIIMRQINMPNIMKSPNTRMRLIVVILLGILKITSLLKCNPI